MDSLEEQLNQVVSLTKHLSRQLTLSGSIVSVSPNKNQANNFTFLSPNMNRIPLDSERLAVRQNSSSVFALTPQSNKNEPGMKNESGVFSRFMNQSPREFELLKSDGGDTARLDPPNQ